MKNRTEAEVYLSEKIDITELLKFIEHKNKNIKNKDDKLTLFHTFITTIFKVIYERPLLNRFISGRQYYDRNEISAAFVVKTKFSDEGKEVLMILEADKNDNVDIIKNKILTNVNKIRTDETNTIDKLMNFVTKGPRSFTRAIVGTAKWLDYHGWLPDSITKGDPYFATLFLTNLGSIKCNQAYHHLTNYGTNSMMLAIGTMKKEEMLFENGQKKLRDTVEIGITCDERIADGFYFARSINLFKYIVSNPQLLDDEISKKTDYNPKKS